MNSILGKLDSYQVLTNLLPGAFFGLALKFFFQTALPTENFGEDILIYYFMGLIINRIGSLVVEPVLKKFCFLKFAPYTDFAKAEKADSKIITLSEMNNYFRALLTCILLLLVIRILKVLYLKWICLFTYWEWEAIALLLVLFLFAYRKQTNYVRKRVEAINSQGTQE